MYTDIQFSQPSGVRMDNLSMLPVATSINSSTYLISEANHIINDFNPVGYNSTCYQTETLPHYETIASDAAPKLNISEANSAKCTFEDLNTPAASSKTNQPKFFGPTITEPPMITGWFFYLLLVVDIFVNIYFIFCQKVQ